jgi:hypothetical protein
VSSDEFGANSYVRVPPDSTGKRTFARRIYAFDYTAGTVAFVIGDTVTGQTSLAEGTVLDKSGTTSAGIIYVIVNDNSPVAEFTNAENLLVDAVFHAVLSAQTPIYAQATVNVGGNNPLNSQYISPEGSSHVRYKEGEQLMDAFGITKFGDSHLVDQLTFQYGLSSYRYVDVSGGVASSLTHLSASNSMALDVDIDIGAHVQRTTNIYYPYHPGFGAVTIMSVMAGDTGKTGIIRRWGRYDDNDGVYFEQSGSGMFVCLRNSTGGSVVTTKISQSSWNVDNLSGNGGPNNISGHSLDPSKLNLYWIDYAWLGAGQVRFGIYGYEGDRHLLHRIENAGINSGPYMKRGNLPFRSEISNSQATASPSRLAVTCVAIHNDGIDAKPENKFGIQYSFVTPTAISASTTAWTPLIAWRGTSLIGSASNRYLSIPGSIGGYTTSPIILQIFQQASLNTGSWTQRYLSGLEFDSSASLVIGGAAVNTWFVEASSSFNFKTTEHTSINMTATSKANGLPGAIWVLAAKSLTEVSSSVYAKLSWSDLE